MSGRAGAQRECEINEVLALWRLRARLTGAAFVPGALEAVRHSIRMWSPGANA